MKITKNKKIYIILFIFGCVLLAAAPDITRADTAMGLLNMAGSAAHYDTSQYDSAEAVGRVIKIFLSLLGVIFIGLMIYGGSLWMTARGNEQQVDKAKDLIKDAVIGLVIILGAYVITYYVVIAIGKGLTTTR